MATYHLSRNNKPPTLSPTSTSIFNDGCNLLRKTPLQLQTLEHLFSDDRNPTQSRLQDYSSALGLTYEQVRRWFIERRQREKKDAARTKKANVSGRSTAKGKSQTKNRKDLTSLELRERGDCAKRSIAVQDMLYSTDYIFKKVFRKDGPPLGVEFAPLPNTAFQGRSDIADCRSCEVTCQDEQQVLKRRKVMQPATLDSEPWSQTKTPTKKHGKGKGLMIWQLVNTNASFQNDAEALKRGKVLPCKDSHAAKKHGKGKGFIKASQPAIPNSKRKTPRRKAMYRRAVTKVQEKRKPLPRRRKVQTRQNENQKAHRGGCKMALNLLSHDENFCSFPSKADDEELELRELQAGSNPFTCGAHFGTGGSHGCSLCKGLLPKFPPDSVRMRKPVSIHPWNSLEPEKKLFKVFHFLYTYAVILDLCPFTFDDFVKAFHDKDSLLLGKLHVCLLDLLLSDIQKESSNGLSVHSNKNGKFLNLLHMAETQGSVVNFFKTSLNPLTWTEILRQVLVAAGFGSKDCNPNKVCLFKEEDHMAKYGLHSGTLKGELFSILFKQGNKGLTANELANSAQIVNLKLGKTNAELEDTICSILASDITLFERISSSAYRLRVASVMKKDEDALTDNEDCGSIDDESRASSFRSSNAECYSEISSSRPDTGYQSPESNILPLSSVIDESHPGESWLLGLMEGEYSDLSIEEKLNAFLALVGLVSAGSSIRMEDPLAALGECVPRMYQQGSGGKIKRSTVRQPSLHASSCGDRENCGVENGHLTSETCPVDSSFVFSRMSDAKYFDRKDSNGVENGSDLHPMQSIFLGSDRRYNRYWLFLGPCDADDLGHKQVYLESSEDGQWLVIDSEEALCCLLATLNAEGRREAVLMASLEKRIESIIDEMSSMVPIDVNVSQSTQSSLSEIERSNEDSPSPISEIDSLSLGERSCTAVSSRGTAPFKIEKNIEERKQKYESIQAFDSWIWNGFYSNLHAVRHGKRSFYDMWTRCVRCHDLYWRDERHCKICHTTFELDFDLEEKYTLHMATCQGPKDGDVYPVHKVLPSKLQALKAAIHMIELILPEDALIGAWKKSAHKLWVRRLRRTSSLVELIQVLADFVGSFNADWVSQRSDKLYSDSISGDFVTNFQNIPHTSSAVALWLVKLDALIALESDEVVIVGTAKGQKSVAPVTISVDED